MILIEGLDCLLLHDCFEASICMLRVFDYNIVMNCCIMLAVGFVDIWVIKMMMNNNNIKKV